ncbi:MAG TPA: 50S ribosomal protein L24 [Bauldia sp.]|nr:50S ribosomal protein L24 [Bauldia sp.]
MAARIKKGDRVVVIAGKDKGRTGEVIRVLPDEDRAVVRGINVARRHQRQTARDQGGIIVKELPIHLSNIAIAAPSDGKPTKIAFRVNKDGVKQRVAKRTGEVIDG